MSYIGYNDRYWSEILFTTIPPLGISQGQGHRLRNDILKFYIKVFSSPGPKGHSELLPYQCVHHAKLENKYSNIFFYKTTGLTVLKFHVENDLTPGSQSYKIGSGRISRMAAGTKNSKNNKTSFFSRTTGYFWLNFGMEYQ